jgi:hypothetical protein
MWKSSSMTIVVEEERDVVWKTKYLNVKLAKLVKE